MSLDELVRKAPAEEPSRSTTAEFARVPALDGVRAIAVIAVLLFHHYQFQPQGSSAWAGGFLGVDVFFVLSGFLITSLLLSEHRRNDHIDLRRFWSRRARRLLPALFVAILGSALLAKFVLDPVTSANLRGESLATLFYVENWYRLGGNGLSTLSPAWSLSIEEQWYLIWPLLFIGLLLWSRGRKSRLVTAIGVLIGASAMECALLFRGAGDRSYYGTDTRAQALLVGAALAVLLSHRQMRSSRVLRVSGWVAAAGLTWLFYVAHSDASIVYDGGLLFAALLAALLIASVVHSQDALLARALSWKPLVAIGLISYGLYLYHMPIYDWLDHSHTDMSGTPLLLLRVAVTLVIAVASYHFIERPFRRGQTLDYKGLAAFAAVGAIVFGVVYVSTPSTRGSPIAKASTGFALAAQGTPSGEQRVLVAGGLPAFQLGLKGIYDDGSIRGAAFSLFGCDVTLGDPVIGGHRNPSAASCTSFVQSMRTLTKVYMPAVTVLMLGPEDARARGVGRDVLPSGSPELGTHVVARIDRAREALTVTGARFVLLPVQCDSANDVSAEQVSWLNRLLARYAQAHPRTVTYVNDLTQPCSSVAPDAKTTWQRIAAAIGSR